MQHRIRSLLVAVAACSALACAWDYDTLRDEHRGLPGVHELLVGRYERRSVAFYRDRVARMEKHLAAQPDDQGAIDNYAVALFRIGQPEQAIAVMEDKERRFPNQYTTASNLATFHMLRGDHALAVPLLEKALRINPNAHFGREEYQLQLARFLVDETARKAKPLMDFTGFDPREGEDDFKHEIEFGSGPATAEEAKARQAIIGMIRFGTDQSPDLFYALGNSLLRSGDRHLAARAYWRAIEAGHPQQAELETLAELALSRVPWARDEQAAQRALFAAERKAGEAWAKAYMDFAETLIARGVDPDVENHYAEFYYRHGGATMPGSWTTGWHEWLFSRQFAIAIGIVLTVIVLIFTLVGCLMMYLWRLGCHSASPVDRDLGPAGDRAT